MKLALTAARVLDTRAEAVAEEYHEQKKEIPGQVWLYPQLRFMGSKYRLLPWLHSVLKKLDFETALDAFSGSGCVSYLLKAMGKTVHTNDFLCFPTTIAQATVENSSSSVTEKALGRLLAKPSRPMNFIEKTFTGIFYKQADLKFLDRIWSNLPSLHERKARAIVVSALIRSCMKRQPRGVFTVAGDPEKYKDGRRDLKLSIEEHFLEQLAIFNRAVFSNGKENTAQNGSIFDFPARKVDLVYMDPPYVPRADDNCYVKRYHFLEGLACYWRGRKILEETRVKKIEKPYTPFSYRRTAIEAFDQLFEQFKKSTMVLSYSSNGYPDLDVLVDLMKKRKESVEVHKKDHTYHFGTHDKVERAQVQEYLIVGR